MQDRLKLEKQQENVLIRKVHRELKIQSIKLNLQGNRGWPDRMFLLSLGKPALIELKRVGEKPTKLQLYRIRLLTELGYDVLWTSDYDLAYNWLKKLQATRVSADRNKADDRSSVLGTAPGPRLGEDLDKSRGK